MKKTPLQKAEEYLQKAKDILDSIPVEDEFDDPLLRHYTDVKSVKKAGRTAWKGCTKALNYVLEKNIDPYDYNAYREAVMDIDYRYYCVFDTAFKMLVYAMGCDGTQNKSICDAAIEDAKRLLAWCKNRQSLVDQHQEEVNKTIEESWRKDKEGKKLDRILVKRQNKELLDLLLEKTGVSRKEIIRLAYNEFVCDNINLLTPQEKKRFDHLVF